MATSVAKSFSGNFTSGSTTTVYVTVFIKNECDFITADQGRMAKCSHCKKKTHLEFKCSCSTEKVFCVKCRASETHSCAIVYPQIELIKVVPIKVEKI
jgi:hypothetical protein